MQQQTESIYAELDQLYDTLDMHCNDIAQVDPLGLTEKRKNELLGQLSQTEKTQYYDRLTLRNQDRSKPD